jgi:thioredoxin reductase (NADPH)
MTQRRPVLFVVDADEEARRETAAALDRRFGADYRVVAVGSPQAGIDELVVLARESQDIALIAADLRLPRMEGLDFLERANALHPGAARVLLVAMDESHTRIPFSELDTLQRAAALGRIDFWVVKGWVTPEEWLYPLIQEALSSWTTAHRPTHVVYRIVGEQWAPRTHDLRDALTSNGVPFSFHTASSAEGRRLIEEFSIDSDRLPALVLYDGRVMHDPTFAELASSHGIRTRPSTDVYDLAIVGAGPAGLAAAVYGASEGLRTLVIEARAIGGQAGTSSLIRNYLGFPRGIGGGDLAHRAWEQALFFGAQFVFSHRANALTVEGNETVIVLADESQARARSVIIAAGVAYRRLGIDALDRLVGAGVFYGAAVVEAPAMAGEHVYVVGSGNSAGQAALHLAKFASQVTLLVRGKSIAAGMSEYLVRQLEATMNIDVQLRTRLVTGHGDSRLQALTLEDGTGQQHDVPATALFVLIGAEPRTAWLSGTVTLDAHGFVLTGRDIPSENWPLARAPLPFETSLPGVLAVGDVRHDSIKRVASAVGEGSVAVSSVHQYLVESAAGRAGR